MIVPARKPIQPFVPAILAKVITHTLDMVGRYCSMVSTTFSLKIGTHMMTNKSYRTMVAACTETRYTRFLAVLALSHILVEPARWRPPCATLALDSLVLLLCRSVSAFGLRGNAWRTSFFGSSWFVAFAARASSPGWFHARFRVLSAFIDAS
jgi:hypothetical protein